MRRYLTILFLVLALVARQLWRQTGDLAWTFAAAGFALASIRETILLLKEIKRQ
jgi:hypothetical protein